ncbi:MAG: helix-turn-helix domain-containing protein [Paracoccaceae bacterium]|nr:helix-turn-helix domain-containing protein [Paracoccaceae bacterium]
MSELAARLRELQDRNNWTVADIAERTGLPKRTLDKYLLRQGASLPGFEALLQLSKGLGVSLDWLVFGSDAASEPIALFAERATFEVTKLLVETLLRYHQEGRSLVENGEELLGLAPIEWGLDLGDRAADFVREQVKVGTTRESLLAWRAAVGDRVWEAIQGRTDRVLRVPSTERK